MFINSPHLKHAITAIRFVVNKSLLSPTIGSFQVRTSYISDKKPTALVEYRSKTRRVSSPVSASSNPGVQVLTVGEIDDGILLQKWSMADLVPRFDANIDPYNRKTERIRFPGSSQR